MGEQRYKIQILINDERWDTGTRNDALSWEVDQYDRKCPEKIADGNSDERDGRE